MTTASKGRSAEWFVRDRYQDEGWRVGRSAGSKGVCDLVATRPGSKALHYISVKVNSWPSGAEADDLRALANECRIGNAAAPGAGVWRVVVYRKDDRLGWRYRVVESRSLYREGASWGRAYKFTVGTCVDENGGDYLLTRS